MYVRICPSFWYQMAVFGVLAHGLMVLLLYVYSILQNEIWDLA